ncbi:MAG: hypothetical protein E7157_05510 [Lactobacillales bacterium]|nr:hypothetical protein [Lactobacillales bacterium]
MRKFNTENLYVVRPSKVIFDNTKLLSENLEKNEAEYIHTVDFEQNKDLATIAHKEDYMLKDVFTKNMFLDIDGVPLHCVEGDVYVSVIENDKISLAKYLYERKCKVSKWNKELEEYIISLKPYYDEEELMEILKIFEDSIEDEIHVKIHERKYSRQILSKRI